MRHHLSLFVLMALSRSGLALAAEPDGPDATTEAARDQAVADDLWAWVARLDGAPLPEEAEAERVEEAASERSARALADAPGGVDLAEDLLADPGRALAGDPLFLDKIDLSEFDLPVVVNDHVEKWMRILLGPQRKYMQRWLERKARFEPMITAKVDAAGLPRDLIYLSMIESGFSPYALSSASAAGLWQFISSTGRMYDLRVDFWVDERRDPELATDAALRMLADLHRMFDDWFLAFAGYNTGPGRVKRALGRASKDDADYWTLLEEDLIHRETQGYVPKILAAAIISKHPERYGFTDLQPHEPLVYDTVEVEGSIDLVVLAECAGIDEEALRALNPALLQRTTPSGTTRLRVPTGGGEAFLAALAEVPPEARRTLVTHVVQRGESLSGIAARYGLTASALASANGIRDVHRIAVGQRLVVPVSGGATATSRATASAAPASPKPPPPAPALPASREGTSSAASYVVRAGDALSVIAEKHGVSQADLVAWNGLADASAIQVGQTLRLAPPAAATPAAPSRPSTYVVQRGDALSVIAARYGVSVSDLVAWNGLRSASSLQVGQTLRLTPAAAGSAPAAVASQAAAPSQTYVVQRGDALSRIAEKYGVSMADLVAWNGLESASSIQVGQKLIIRGGAPPATEWVSYTVRSGDSLERIARAHGVDVRDLQSWNGLRGTTIHPGQRLRIRKS